MKRFLSILLFMFLFPLAAKAQNPEIHFVADTLVVQADGTYESDPDWATLTFAISSPNKDLKPAYESAAQSAQRIVALAQANGLKKGDIALGVLTLSPSYETDRKNRAKSYLVQSQITLRVRDFL
jgi:uncharacterized protein YggE